MSQNNTCVETIHENFNIAREREEINIEVKEIIILIKDIIKDQLLWPTI